MRRRDFLKGGMPPAAAGIQAVADTLAAANPQGRVNTNLATRGLEKTGHSRFIITCRGTVVRDEVRRRIEDLAPGGGYVLTAVHNIQADVPPQNIMAMVEALAEFGAYS